VCRAVTAGSGSRPLAPDSTPRRAEAPIRPGLMCQPSQTWFAAERFAPLDLLWAARSQEPSDPPPTHAPGNPRDIGGSLALLAVAAIVPSAAHAAAGTQRSRVRVGPSERRGRSEAAPCPSRSGWRGERGARGALSVSSSTVTGAITLEAGYLTFDFCGSRTVRGAISATGGTAAVLIGGSGLLGSLLCPANTIDGAVTLNANLAGVTLAHSYTSGASRPAPTSEARRSRATGSPPPWPAPPTCRPPPTPACTTP
jgi:hypothetical protein